MMFQRKTIATAGVAVLLVLLAGGAYYLFFGDEDEQIIQRNLARMVELVEKTGDESPFVSIGNSREAMRYIAQEPTVQVGPPFPVITERRELEAMLIQARQSLHSLTIRIVSNELTVAEDGQTARMEIEAEGRVTYSGETGRERRRFTIDWIKEDGDWVVQRVRLHGDSLPGGERVLF